MFLKTVIGIKSFTAFIQCTVDGKACQSLSSLSKHWRWFWEEADTFLNKAPYACEINGVFHQYNFIYSGQTILAINMKLRNLHLSRIFCDVINENMIWLHISNMILETQTCGKICLDKTFEGGRGHCTVLIVGIQCSPPNMCHINSCPWQIPLNSVTTTRGLGTPTW